MYKQKIKEIEQIIFNVIKQIKKQQKKDNINLSEEKEEINIILMIANNFLSLKGNNDLNFALINKIIENNNYGIIKNKEEELIKLATINNNITLLMYLLFKRYEDIKITNSIIQINNEMILLMNIKNNLNEDNIKIFDSIIINYINIYIFKKENNEEKLKENLILLTEELNKKVEKEKDYIYISDYIFTKLKEQNILK